MNDLKFCARYNDNQHTYNHINKFTHKLYYKKD